METETRKDRIIRIIRTIMFNYKYDSVQKFADDIGANYMQVYYCSIGKTTTLSPDLEDKILAKFQDLNPSFLKTGLGSVTTDNIPTTIGERESFEVTNADMFRLLERITTLLEKVQEREDLLVQRIEELKRREKELDDKIKSSENSLNVC